MRATFSLDMERVRRELDRAAAPLRRMARRAVNELAFRAQEAVVQEMQRRFVNPTPWVLKGTFVKIARGEETIAELGWKDMYSVRRQSQDQGGGMPAREVLAPHIDGGARRLKRFEQVLRSAGIMRPNEYAVISKVAPKNRYGNIPREELVAILSDLRAFNEVGFTANRRRDARATKGKYFAITSDQRDHGKRRVGLAPGIYRNRRAPGLRPVMMFRFVERTPSYRLRFAPAEVAARVVREQTQEVWKLAMERRLPDRTSSGRIRGPGPGAA